MTYADKYEEHLASQPDNSRWHGFDRGTSWADEDLTPVERVIGRMTNKNGQRVVIREVEFDAGDKEYSVYINGDRVFCDLDCLPRAVRVARRWMVGFN